MDSILHLPQIRIIYLELTMEKLLSRFSNQSKVIPSGYIDKYTLWFLCRTKREIVPSTAVDNPGPCQYTVQDNALHPSSCAHKSVFNSKSNRDALGKITKVSASFMVFITYYDHPISKSHCKFNRPQNLPQNVFFKLLRGLFYCISFQSCMT